MLRWAMALALAASCCSAAGAAEQAPTSGPEWPQLRGGPGFAGVSADDSVKPPFKLLWSYRCDSDTSGDAAVGLTVAGGKVFCPMVQTRSVLALNADTGRLLWEYAPAHGVNSYATLTYEGGRLYVGRAACLTALDGETGKEVWTKNVAAGKNVVTSGALDAYDRWGPLLYDGKAYVADATDEPTIIALDAKTGNEVWRTPLGKEHGNCVIAPSAGGGRVFTGTVSMDAKRMATSGRVIALDAKDGRIAWANPDVRPCTLMATDGTLLIAKSNRLKTYALDAKTGKEIWSLANNGSYRPEALAGDRVIMKTYGPTMAVDRATGKTLWSGGAGSGCSGPSVSGRYAYVGTSAFNNAEGIWAWRFLEPPHSQKGTTGLCWTLHAIDIETGKSVWQHVTGNCVCGDPAIAYGRLYFNSRDGRIYCMAPVKEGENALPDSPDKSASASAEDVRKLLAARPAAAVDEKDWPMLGGGPERAGRARPAMALPLESAWTLETGGRILASPAVRAGRVFAGSLSGKIVAAELDSGKKIWEFQTGGEVRCSPAAADGIVYCGSDDGFFYALEETRGEVKWKYACGAAVQASPAVAGGIVVFGANDHNVYALDRATGKRLWSFRAEQPLIQSPPVVHGGRVYAAQWLDWAYAIDAATGKEIWRTCVPVSIESLHLHDKTLWLRSAYQFAELDPATGKRLSIGNAPYGYSGLAFAGRRMFITGSMGAEMAVWPGSVDLDSAGVASNEKNTVPSLKDARALSIKAFQGAPCLMSMGTPLVLGETIAIATRKGELVVTDFQGKVLWSQTLGGQCHGSPVAASGLLLVGCDDGKIYAFREKAK